MPVDTSRAVVDLLERARSCVACGGAYHEVRGHALCSGVVLCGGCGKSFLAWLFRDAHVDGARFHAAAASAIRADKMLATCTRSTLKIRQAGIPANPDERANRRAGGG